MTIDLPPQIERIVHDAILTGQYHSVEDVLTEAVTVWQTRKEERTQLADEERREAIDRLTTFGKRHGLSLGGITIHELRHEARP
jgi:Arc/MetJ-type ribon-helix-helix transcriptional regulator